MTDQHAAESNVSADFVFGTLATDDLRIAQLRVARGGVAHGQRISPADPRPGEAVTVRASTGPRVAAERVTCYYTTDGSDPAGARGVATSGMALELARDGVEWDTLLWGYVAEWAGTLPGQPAGTLVRYRIEAWSERGPSRWASEIAGVVGGAPPDGLDPLDAELFALPGQTLWPVRRPGSYAYHVDAEQVPGWLRDAVIYHIFVDRFDPGGGRPFQSPGSLGGIFGGTLRGVMERLDEIQELGATCLWLSPIFPSPSHHGYDATDYQAIEARLGSLDDLRALTDAAHARGMRVILDYVVNHVSGAHPAFQAALADRGSPEAGWFTFTRWPDQYLSFFGVLDHPQIDADNPGARDYMIESARFWLAQGVDGFRLDYANGPSHAFWSAFRAATRAAHPESVTFGEVVETPALQRSYAGRMDGCLDFLLMQAMRQLFAFGTLRVSEFAAFLERHLAFFPPDFVLPSFLDNHDMNRFLWVVRGDARRLKLAALCQFTLPNPPIVYYGTEVGLSQERDVRSPDGSGHPEESRTLMPRPGEGDAAVRDFYRRLVALRAGALPLWRGERSAVLADDETGALVFRCAADRRAALVALNTGASARSIPLPQGAGHRLALATDEAATIQGERLELPALAGAVVFEGGA